MSLASNRGSLLQRAEKLSTVRHFFLQRNVLEVDTPLLSPFAPIDAHIDVMLVDMGKEQTGYLHTSPEYAMKKLLSKGSGDIYQLSHVFRADEEGPLHTPEFTMIEWYRVDMQLHTLIHETLELIQLFLGEYPAEILTYQEAFEHYCGLNPHEDDLAPMVTRFASDAASWDRDTQLHLLFSHIVEPQMPNDSLTVITGFPASQAALAKTEEVGGVELAKRFEIYLGGVELANGFDELSDPAEQKRRFETENQKRINLGKAPLPFDREFVACLKSLPECVGVAVGFDRLMMLSTGPTSERWGSASPH